MPPADSGFELIFRWRSSFFAIVLTISVADASLGDVVSALFAMQAARWLPAARSERVDMPSSLRSRCLAGRLCFAEHHADCPPSAAARTSRRGALGGC